MAGFVAGDVVVVPFPFTDLQSHKVRPAIVVAAFTRGDILLCQITSRTGGHPAVIPINTTDFALGALPVASQALPHRIVTANETCVRKVAGQLTPAKLTEIREALCAAVRQG